MKPTLYCKEKILEYGLCDTLKDPTCYYQCEYNCNNDKEELDEELERLLVFKKTFLVTYKTKEIRRYYKY